MFVPSRTFHRRSLDSSEEETREYFQRHKLDNDLCNRFQAVKSSGRILTVHRYGSATIRSDHNLVFAIQESIEKALVDAGIENKGGNALKEATIAWLSDKDNKNYFNGLITGTYSNLFGGDDADTVIEKLRTFSGDALAKVMDNIFKVADERQVKALSLSVTDLSNWIREVIQANSLKAIASLPYITTPLKMFGFLNCIALFWLFYIFHNIAKITIEGLTYTT